MESKHGRDRRHDFGDREGRRHRSEDLSRRHRSSRRSSRRRSASRSSSSTVARKDRSRRDNHRKVRHERSSSSSEHHRRRKRRKNTRRSRTLSRNRSRTLSRSRPRSRSRSRSPSRQKRPDRRHGDRLGSSESDRHHRRKHDDNNPHIPRDRDLGGRDRRRRGHSASTGRERPRRERRKRRQRRSRRSRGYSSSHSSSSSASLRRQRQRAPAPPTRAGVVSDDDDANVAGANNFGPVSRGGPPPPHSVRPDDNSRIGHNRRRSNKRKRGSCQSNSAAHDDTVGHFWGGPGTVVADTYRVERELGVGTFGRVVECLDMKSRDRGQRSCQDNNNHHHHLVAIKMVRKVKRYYESALIEADIVADVNRRGGPRGRGTSHFAVMFDRFNFRGHYCLVFESLGPSLYDYLKRNKYQPFPMRCVRDFSKQLLEAIEFLHSFRLIHTDLKPENILLTKCREVSYGHQKLPESTRIKVIDFGGATYDDEKKSSVVNTRQYRAPEVILSCGWSMPSDLWSAGCILCELYTGELLFATHDNLEHLALIERIIGPFPRQMLQRAYHFNSAFANQAFDANGRHQLGRVLPPDSASYVVNMPPLESIVQKKKDGWFLKLLRSILVIDPESRSSARDALHNCLADRPL